MKRNALIAILCGGFVAGSLDIFAAAAIYAIDPATILRSIARGLLGKEAYAGGAASASLGLILQWVMSLIIAAVYVAASTRLPSLNRHWIPAGLGYGVVIFIVMNYIVVPLSRVAAIPHFTPTTFALNMLAMLLFGLIVAYFAQRQTGYRSV